MEHIPAAEPRTRTVPAARQTQHSSTQRRASCSYAAGLRIKRLHLQAQKMGRPMEIPQSACPLLRYAPPPQRSQGFSGTLCKPRRKAWQTQIRRKQTTDAVHMNEKTGKQKQNIGHKQGREATNPKNATKTAAQPGAAGKSPLAPPVSGRRRGARNVRERSAPGAAPAQRQRHSGPDPRQEPRRSS